MKGRVKGRVNGEMSLLDHGGSVKQSTIRVGLDTMHRRIANAAAGRAQLVAGALLVFCGTCMACGGNERSNADAASSQLDAGADAARDADTSADAVALLDAFAPEDATDAGCAVLLDAAQTTVDDLILQYDSCEEAGDCVAVPVFGNCAIVSVAGSAAFLDALAPASQDFESAGCSAPSISCDSVQVKCQGRCTSDGPLILGP
jgi:hypothetical protein